MSCFRLPKKLLPSKKACKSFLSTLSTSVRRLRQPKTRRHRLHRRGHQEATTIYVDRLYPADDREARVAEEVSPARTRGQGRGGGKGERWKAYLESLPPIRGVDERAEEFITSFRQQMKIEREQSLLDFQEMLARSK